MTIEEIRKFIDDAIVRSIPWSGVSTELHQQILEEIDSMLIKLEDKEQE